MRKLLFGLYLLLSGCTDPIKFTIHEDFKKHVAEFQRLYKVEVTVTIMFADFPQGEFGLCKNYGTNNRLNIVYIDRLFWISNDYYAQEELLFHELGHCVLGRKHLEGLMVLGEYINAPKSIMYSIPFGYLPIYVENRDFYLKELGTF